MAHDTSAPLRAHGHRAHHGSDLFVVRIISHPDPCASFWFATTNPAPSTATIVATGFPWSPPTSHPPLRNWWLVTPPAGESSKHSPTPAKYSESVRLAIAYAAPWNAPCPSG